MAYSVPSDIPDTLTAGSTWAWTASFSDFPASEGWTLTYYVSGDESTFSITATSDGSGYRVNVPTSMTGVAAGTVKITPQVSNGTETYPLDAVWRTILPDPATSEAGEHRTYNQQLVEKLEAQVLERATADLSGYSIAGRSAQKEELARLTALLNAARGALWRERNPGVAMPQVKVSFGPA